MEHYQECQEENNIPKKNPIHNYVISPMSNKPNIRPPKIIQLNLMRQNEQVYTSPRYIIQRKNEYKNINNNEPNQNNLKYNNQNKQQQYNYSNQYDVKNIDSNHEANTRLTKDKSSDGILRGYNYNYSYYVSGSPKNTINNQYNNKININYQNNNQNQTKNQTRRHIIYKSPPKTNIEQYHKNIYSNNISQNTFNNYSNRQIIGNENSSYIIKLVEKKPVIYNQPNQQYSNNNNYNINYNNYNNYNNEDDIYHFNGNENRLPQRYEGSKLQRRMVKRVIEKEPMDSRKDYLIIGPNDNLRNIKRNKNRNNNNIIIQQKPFYQKINNNNINHYYNNINERITNLNSKNAYLSTYP